MWRGHINYKNYINLYSMGTIYYQWSILIIDLGRSLSTLLSLLLFLLFFLISFQPIEYLMVVAFSHILNIE